MNKNLEYEIRDNFEEALNRFDFATIYDVMRYMDWTWHGESRSPSVKEMIETVEELFKHAIESFNDSEICTASGGFYVRIYKDGKVEIQFVVKHSESYDRQ